MSEKLERPPLKIHTKLSEGEYTVHMSYGLFSDLQRMCPDVAQLLEAGLSDAWARDYIIRRCMTDSKKMITDEKDLIQPEDMKLDDPVEIEKLLSWVTGHLLYFFVTSAAGLKKMGEKFQSQIQTTPAAPSKSGSES
jgi:hypothetical protein